MATETTSVPPIATVRDRGLSLWQSAVAHVVRQEVLMADPAADTSASSRAIRDHHAMRAVTAHVIAQQNGINVHDAGTLIDQFATNRQAFATSQVHFEIAEASRLGDTERLAILADVPVRKYSTDDWSGWATCVTQYLAYYSFGASPMYRDWKDPQYGNGNINYSVIDYQLPPNATVAIIGDWGTGMPDAVQLFSAVVAMNPTIIIHLGDIYYSGTPEECTANFLDVVKAAYSKAGVKIPIFTIPGNHEYYSGGVGYYQLLDELAEVQPSASCNQPASYFCLRTSDGAFQFLGMDTGYNDHNPAIQTTGPSLQPNEIQWQIDKIKNFKGKTILLSHHQLYSANATINTFPWDTAYLNDGLYATFQPYFPLIAGWLWGHEHNLVLYQNNIFGLGTGRLIGCSSYEETQAENPYQVNHPEVPYLANAPQLSVRDAYYNHGFAMMTMGSGQMPKITYYEFPSWGDYDPPTNPQPTALFNEQLVTPSSFTTQIWETSLPSCGYQIVSSLAANGTFYAGSNGYVYLLNPTTGAVEHTNPLPGRGRNEIRMTYFANASVSCIGVGSNGYAIALDPNTLITRWQTSLPSCGYNIVSMINDGTNLYAGSNGYVYSLNPSSGAVQHTNSLSGTGSQEVRFAISGGVLYVGTNGYALALRTSDLSTIWKTSLPGCGYNICSVATDGNYLYAGCNGHIYQLRLSDGGVVHRNDLSGMGYNEVRLAIGDGRLYVGTDGFALGLTLSDLTTSWQLSLPSCGYQIVDMLSKDGQLYAASNGYVYRLTPGTGTPLLYTNSLSGLGRNEVRLALANNTVLVGTNGYAVGLTSTAAADAAEAIRMQGVPAEAAAV